MESPLVLPGRQISIRQTRNTYVRDRDIEYIAYAEATLDERGRLDMTNLGVGAPGDSFHPLIWERKPHPNPSIQLQGAYLPSPSWHGFMPPRALEMCLIVGEDARPVLIVIEYHDYERSKIRARLVHDEESRQRDLKLWADIRKTILSPVTWICTAANQYIIRRDHEELSPTYSESESDSSLAVVRKSPMDPGQHNGIGGLNDETASRIPKRRLVAGKVDKADTKEL